MANTLIELPEKLLREAEDVSSQQGIQIENLLKRALEQGLK